MPNARMIKSVIREYGAGWLVNRTLYSAKLKMLRVAPPTEKWFEKKSPYPKRLDLFDVDVFALKAFLQEKLSDKEKKRLVEIANKSCQGILTGFSSIELNYGNPIDWQLNPLTGKKCDEKQNWYRIPDFEEERGDIKVIWEASRFSHFITITRAFLLTGDEKYYNAFSFQLKDWLEKNPYEFGANFKCSQECSLRMVNGLLSFSVFRKAGFATDADASNVKDLVDRCYRKVLSNFFYAYKCIKNNHTISELMGMIVGAWCCDDQRQLKKAYKQLDKVINEQFTADGGYRQFSFNYQRLALQDVEVVLSIERKTGKKLSDRTKKKIKNSAWLMYQCQDKSGDMPNYGSNDGALVFPVTSCGYRDFRPVVNTAYALVTGKQIFNSGKHQEELIWFSGGKGLQEYEGVELERCSSRFANAGIFTIRDKRSWAMVVNNNYSSRPGHMDQQHFDLWIDRVNVFCDAGTYSYASNEGRRLAINESHNTAVIEGCSQMNARGPFMIYDWTKRELGICDDGSYDGKMISANGYTHHRVIRKIGFSYEILDECDKDFCIRLHTPCEAEQDDKGYRLNYNGKTLCRIKSNGAISVLKDERSLYYLKKEDTICLVIKGQAEMEIKTTIVIEGEMGDD